MGSLVERKSGREKKPIVDTLLDEPEKNFDLSILPCRSEHTPHGIKMRERLPPVPTIDGDGAGAAARAYRSRARKTHWARGLLSGIFHVVPGAPPDADPELVPARWARSDGYTVGEGASKPGHASLLWCFREGQRVALLRGTAPYERVRATACVVRLEANGEYHLETDLGAGLRFDPTGQHRVTLQFPLQARPRADADPVMDRRPESAGSSSRPPEEPSPFGFDVDDTNAVVRVDGASWAEHFGVRHGWVATAVDGEPVHGSSAMKNAARRSVVSATVRRKPTVDVAFDVLTHELLRPGVEYASGQRVSILHRTRWRDAIVLRKPLEDEDAASKARTRLRIFLGDSGHGAVETGLCTLNMANHALLFLPSKQYVDELKRWRLERPEWGEMFDTVRRRCLGREASHHSVVRESYHGLVNGVGHTKPKWAGPETEMPRYQATALPTPRVYAWQDANSRDPFFCRAPDGSPWSDVGDLRRLTQALLHRRHEDLGQGAVANARLLLVDGKPEDTGHRLAERRKSTRQTFEARELQRRTSRAASPGGDRSPSISPTKAFEDQSSDGPGRKTRVKQLIEAIPIMEFGEHSRKLAQDMAVKAAAKKIGAMWNRRSMVQYARPRRSVVSDGSASSAAGAGFDSCLDGCRP